MFKNNNSTNQGSALYYMNTDNIKISKSVF